VSLHGGGEGGEQEVGLPKERIRLLTHQKRGLVPKLQQFPPLAPLQSLVAVQSLTVYVFALQFEGGLSLQEDAATQDDVSDVGPPAQPLLMLPMPLSTRVPQHTSPDA
jgi:hypothetical protein